MILFRLRDSCPLSAEFSIEDETHNSPLRIGRFASPAGTRIEAIKEISEHIAAIQKNVYKMIEARKKANALEEAQDKAHAYCEYVKPYFDEIREHADKLEFIVDDELWALPKYRELLFLI